MSKNKKIGATLTLLLVALVASTVAVSAFRGPLYGQSEDPVATRAAIEANDFAAFKESIGDSAFADKITEEKFEKMVNRHKQKQAVHDALLANDFAAFQEATAESKRLGSVSEQRFAEMVEHVKQKELAKEAIKQSDFAAWQSAIDQMDRTPAFFQEITEENFDLLVEMHQAKEAGDFDRVSELREELGMPERMHRHHARKPMLKA